MSENKSNAIETRARIIDEAMKLFIADGIKDTTMTDIAKYAEINRRTLYRYYETKNELAFEIAYICREKLSKQEKFGELQGDNGFEKLKKFLELLFNSHLVIANIKLSRYLAEYDYHFMTTAVEYEKNTRLEELGEVFRIVVEKLILKGVEDGSISANIDPFSISTLFETNHIALAHRCAISVDTSNEISIKNSFEALRGFYDLLLLALKK